jgi:hypothetical protein
VTQLRGERRSPDLVLSVQEVPSELANIVGTVFGEVMIGLGDVIVRGLVARTLLSTHEELIVVLQRGEEEDEESQRVGEMV